MWVDTINITRNEWIAAMQHKEFYSIYRVYFIRGGVVMYIIKNLYQKGQDGLIDVVPMTYRVDFQNTAVDERNDINVLAEYKFPKETNKNNWMLLSVAVSKLAIEEQKNYFSERAVQGMKKAKNNMKRGLYQDLDKPCLTVTSHLAKVSLNSRNPVQLVNPKRNYIEDLHHWRLPE